MESNDDIRRLLEEIRDTQREHLAEYRKAAERSVALQEEAVERQRKQVALYRWVVLVGALLVVVIGVILFDLLGLLSSYR